MKSKKGSIVVVFFIIIMIAIFAGGAYAYFLTDIFKSPKELFFKYFADNVNRVAEFNLQPFEDFNETSKTVQTEMNFSEKVGVNNKEELKESISEMYGEDEASKELLLNYIDNGELIFNIKNDPIGQRTEVSSQLKAKEEVFYLIETYISPEQMAISYPDLYDKYIGFKNENIKQMFINAGITDEEVLKNIPDKIDFTQITDRLSDNQFTAIEDKYIDDFILNLPEDNFTKESGVELEVNGKKIKTNLYRYTVSGEVLYGNLTNTITSYLNDAELLALLTAQEKEQLNTLKTSYNENKADLEKELSKTEFWKSVTIDVYVSDNKTVCTSMYSGDGANKIEFVPTANDLKLKVNYKDENEIEGIYLVTVSNVVNNGQGEAKITVKNEYVPETIEAAINKLKDGTDKNENNSSKEDNNENSFDSENDFASHFDTFENEFKIDAIKNGYKDSDAVINIKSNFVDANNITGSISLSGKSFEEIPVSSVKFTLKADPNIPFTDLKESNCEYINNYTEEDYVKLGTQLLINFAKAGEEKPNTLIGTVYGIVKSFISVPSVEDTTTPDSPLDIETEMNNNDIEKLPTQEDKEHSEEIRKPTPNVEQDVNFDRISSKVKNAIEYCLLRCQTELASDPNADVSNYFSIDAINKNLENSNITVDFIDGETLKVLYKGNEYRATISVDEKYILNTFKMVRAEDYRPTLHAN